MSTAIDETDLATMIETLPAIALDELNDRAGLLTRTDRKYVLPVADLPVLMGSLAAGVSVLQIEGRRSFAYRSVYFDTPGLTSYLAAARRRRRRFKIRIRSYLDSDLHFVEVKTRGSRGVTVKERIPHHGPADALGESGQAHADLVLARTSPHPARLPLGPVLTTRYRRCTLFLPATESRVTIDTDLSWALPGGPTTRISDCAVVETKSARSTSDVDRLLWSLKHRPSTISKYATGLAALRPELPANRWRPVLCRHFPGTDTGSAPTL